MSDFYVLYNRFPELAEQIKIAADRIVRRSALQIEAQAKVRTPVDTGFLRNSIYTVTHDNSNYPGESGDAQHQMLPEVPRPPVAEAVVAVGASYSQFVEFGTVHMGAQPYLLPAADLVRPVFFEAMSQLEAAIRAGGAAGGA